MPPVWTEWDLGGDALASSPFAENSLASASAQTTNFISPQCPLSPSLPFQNLALKAQFSYSGLGRIQIISSPWENNLGRGPMVREGEEVLRNANSLSFCS